jgi:hypothetical protein
MSNEQSDPSRAAVQSDTADDAQKPDNFDQPLYLPLLNGELIRLVELSPGARDDPVVIRLFIAELQHHPEYEALSYVWGDPENKVPIQCNGRRVEITVNLNAAFVRVRYSGRPRMLWADAVCSYSDRSSIKDLGNLRYLISSRFSHVTHRRATSTHIAHCTAPHPLTELTAPLHIHSHSSLHAPHPLT